MVVGAEIIDKEDLQAEQQTRSDATVRLILSITLLPASGSERGKGEHRMDGENVMIEF